MKIRGMPNEKYQSIVKNIYRVLLYRSMKGSFVYFMDKNTENPDKQELK